MLSGRAFARTLVLALTACALQVGTGAAQESAGFRDASGLWWTHPLDHPYRRSVTREVLESLPAVGEELSLGALSEGDDGSVAGETGTVVVAIRSLDWSPFCRAQVDAWSRRADRLAELGYRVVVVSGAASEVASPLPVLVDSDDRLGLRNPLIAPDEAAFGTLVPGTWVLDGDGRVVHRFLERHHARRATPGTVLAALGSRELGEGVVTVAGQGLRVSVGLLDPELWLEAQSTVVVRLQLEPGRYIYTDPLPDGFIATTVQVLPSDGLRFSRIVYPEAETKEFPDLGVTLPIYQGVADFLVPVRATSEQLGLDLEKTTNGYPLFVQVDYQTCSESFCFSPQTLEVYVEAAARALVTDRAE